MIQRKGLAGFVGGYKNRIRGFFRSVYSVTSIAVIPPDTSFGVTSIISGGLGVSSLMTSVGLSVESTIYPSEGLTSIITENGQGVTSTITSTGQSVDSGI